LASAGPLTKVTREKQPSFIQVVASPSAVGMIRFDVKLRSDLHLDPSQTRLEIRDGDRVTLKVSLALVRDPKNDAWVVTVDADAEQIRNARVEVTYCSRPKMPPMSQVYSFALSEFTAEKPAATRPAK
jgi:hypothetical protein